eukprot:1573937-Lingulodinium_polyedra.AAC.1
MFFVKAEREAPKRGGRGSKGAAAEMEERLPSLTLTDEQEWARAQAVPAEGREAATSSAPQARRH